MKSAVRKLLWTGLGIGAVIAAYLAYLTATGFFDVDACLDGGGSFHYDRWQCSSTETYRGEIPPSPPLWPF